MICLVFIVPGFEQSHYFCVCYTPVFWCKLAPVAAEFIGLKERTPCVSNPGPFGFGGRLEMKAFGPLDGTTVDELLHFETHGELGFGICRGSITSGFLK